jgi:hypothetical protein
MTRRAWLTCMPQFSGLALSGGGGVFGAKKRAVLQGPE